MIKIKNKQKVLLGLSKKIVKVNVIEKVEGKNGKTVEKPVEKEVEVIQSEAKESIPTKGIIFEFNSLSNFEFAEMVSPYIKFMGDGDIAEYRKVIELLKSHLVKVHNHKDGIDELNTEMTRALIEGLLRESTMTVEDSFFLD